MRYIANLVNVLSAGMGIGLGSSHYDPFSDRYIPKPKPSNPNNSRGGPPEPFQETGNKPLISKRAERRMRGKNKGKKVIYNFCSDDEMNKNIRGK